MSENSIRIQDNGLDISVNIQNIFIVCGDWGFQFDG